jgi:hypothetical protein
VSGRHPIPGRGQPRGPRAGFVYLLALLVVLVVSSIAVAMANGAGLRLRADQDALARSQCRAAALGVLRAVVNDLTASMAGGALPKLVTVDPKGETVGGCVVVLVGRDPAAASARFGLIPEAGKLDVNQAPTALLAALPGMNDAIAAAIGDWRDTDDAPDPAGGAERTDSAYSGAAVPYAPRNFPLETLEELRLVRGVTDALWFGEDVNGNGRLDPGEDTDGDGTLTPGLRDLLTLGSREPGVGKVSVANAGALRSLLTTLFPGDRGTELAALAQSERPYANRLDLIAALDLNEDEAAALWPNLSGPEGRLGLVDAWSSRAPVLEALVGADLAKAIIAARPATMPEDPAWLVAALGRQNAKAYGNRLTSGSYQFRADLLAVRADGSGWARLDATIDCAVGAVRVVRVRPAEVQGWPLPWATPEQLRQAQPRDLVAFLTTGQP